MIETFMNTYTDLLFTHFPPDLILSIMEIILNGLKDDPTIKTQACNAI